MSIVWKVVVKSTVTNGGEITRYLGFTFQRRVRQMGQWALELNADNAQAALFALDAQVQFLFRAPEAGLDWVLDYEGLCRDLSWEQKDDGSELCRASGYCLKQLLNRRIVNAGAGSAQALKSGAAETIMKAFVEEQCGPSAGTRALSGFSVEADQGRGNVLTPPDYAHAKVLKICEELALTGGGDYDVVSTGLGTFEFRWYLGQRGTDRRTTVRFTKELGTMANAKLQRIRSAEHNAVLVCGQGQGETRPAVWVVDESLVDDSAWNRSEVFVNGNAGGTDPDQLGEAGLVALEKGRPKWTLSWDTLQTKGWLYGRDYTFGDIVYGTYRGYETAKKLSEMSVAVSGDGQMKRTFTPEDV